MLANESITIMFAVGPPTPFLISHLGMASSLNKGIRMIQAPTETQKKWVVLLLSDYRNLDSSFKAWYWIPWSVRWADWSRQFEKPLPALKFYDFHMTLSPDLACVSWLLSFAFIPVGQAVLIRRLVLKSKRIETIFLCCIFLYHSYLNYLRLFSAPSSNF